VILVRFLSQRDPPLFPRQVHALMRLSNVLDFFEGEPYFGFVRLTWLCFFAPSIFGSFKPVPDISFDPPPLPYPGHSHSPTSVEASWELVVVGSLRKGA